MISFCTSIYNGTESFSRPSSLSPQAFASIFTVYSRDPRWYLVYSFDRLPPFPSSLPSLALNRHREIRWATRMGSILWLTLLILVYARDCLAQLPPVTTESLKQVAGSLTMYVDDLPQMPKLYGYSIRRGSPVPTRLAIGMYQKQWKFHRDLPPTAVFVYGTSRATATFPGPAIEAVQGIPLSVTWLNFLPQRHILPWDPTLPTAIPKNGGVPTSVHLHSGVNPPHSDGSALAWFTAGFQERGPAWTRTTYTYPNVQHSGNLWYHDHALGMIPANLLAGLLGTYTIRDTALDARLNLPSGSEFDRQLVIADRSFTKDGSLYLNATGVDPSVHPQWHPEFFGEVMTVNGKAWPYMNVKSRKYRFRILNAGNARYLRLSLSNGLPFTVVASDSSYLPSPVVTTTLLLSPSEIADVVVDFSQSSAPEIELLNDAPYPYPGGDTTGPLDGKVMKFVVVQGKPYPADRSVIPASLVSYTPASLSEAAVTRYITLYEEISNTTGQPVQLYINGLTLLDPVTETPKPGTTELWNVINLTEDNHPLHLHLASFQAVKVQELLDLQTFKTCMVEKKDAVRCNVGAHATESAAPIPEYERTWKNAVKIAEGHLTSVIVKFSLVDNNKPYPFDATAEPGYVYHCHILDHEGNGMIRPLKLVS